MLTNQPTNQPYTHACVFVQVTVPYMAPLFQKAKILMDGKVQMLFVVVNSGYLWILWMTFMTLPEEARRFVVIAAGTVYPMIASTVSITTKSASPDYEETFWLTYWCCYSILFVAMDYLETFVGSIKGFYSICLCITVYL